jgi:hypothetical protein
MNTSVRKVLLSPDHSIFAYNTEREGMEYGDLHLKDLDDRGRVKIDSEKKKDFLAKRFFLGGD